MDNSVIIIVGESFMWKIIKIKIIIKILNNKEIMIVKEKVYLNFIKVKVVINIIVIIIDKIVFKIKFKL